MDAYVDPGSMMVALLRGMSSCAWTIDHFANYFEFDCYEALQLDAGMMLNSCNQCNEHMSAALSCV